MLWRTSLITFMAAALTAFGQPARQMRAGAFAADITPRQWPVRVIGGFEQPLAEEAHDLLHARALVLADGSTKIAIVVVDSCFLPRALIDRAKARAETATRIPANHMLVAATHTHSAPPSKPEGASAVELAYQQLLKRNERSSSTAAASLIGHTTAVTVSRPNCSSAAMRL